jgi:hypothetical protein
MTSSRTRAFILQDTFHFALILEAPRPTASDGSANFDDANYIIERNV